MATTTGAGRFLGALLASDERIPPRALVQLVLRAQLPPVRQRELIREILGLDKEGLAAAIHRLEADAAGGAPSRPLTRQAVSKVFRGQGRSERVENGIAGVFSREAGQHLPVALLFPEYHSPLTAVTAGEGGNDG